MELKNNQESHEALIHRVAEYYRARSESYLPIGSKKVTTSVIDGKTYEDGYTQEFFVKRKYFIVISIPIDTRNFFASLSLGVGPGYAPLRWLVTEENQSKISMESTTEGVKKNLALLDEYLAGRLT